MQNIIYYLPIFGALGLLYVVWKSAWVAKQDAGTDKMKKIAQHISDGAMAFLKAEYKVLIIFVACVSVLLAVTADSQTSSPLVGVSFALGAFSSALAGYIGMRVATKANVRTTNAARTSLGKALEIAFVGGSVMGMGVVGIGVLGLSVLFIVYGNMFGADVQSVPGTSNMLVSTGASQSFSGSSYSLDGGHNWTTIETGIQRVALGIADSLTMWCGGFTLSPTANGVFKFINVSPVSCNDVNINPGTPSSDYSTVCGGDTVTFTTSGVYGPNNGSYSGISWVLSSEDISGSLNPTNRTKFFNFLFGYFPCI